MANARKGYPARSGMFLIWITPPQRIALFGVTRLDLGCFLKRSHVGNEISQNVPPMILGSRGGGKDRINESKPHAPQERVLRPQEGRRGAETLAGIEQS
ncbi:uncharacterized protein BT62DRAFT_1080709 [Guyanagaster necrorhizus]|uniref:Uncharacterized protein n=1 Tax=Guyanagaster necrorhizus TaxID=856835 RepID=A0A9P7VIC2_9AGAR|nr:uncharacterized protein BT62DRAFT_1080709 [Guyanagaster necrorhizus MCA 3950]KAG7440576.1 hypothetical protein BT62DRAFT_1080709 [Guyanagaster necrorhizus MCA 3950]